jgi:hypothetical protein
MCAPNLLAYGGGKTGAAAPAPRGRDLHLAEQPVNSGRAYPQNKWPLVGAQLQSAMPFQRRQERRDHDHQPLAA